MFGAAHELSLFALVVNVTILFTVTNNPRNFLRDINLSIDSISYVGNGVTISLDCIDNIIQFPLEGKPDAYIKSGKRDGCLVRAKDGTEIYLYKELPDYEEVLEKLAGYKYRS